MVKKKQSARLTKQHKKSHGEVGIFGIKAKEHDSLVCKVSKKIITSLQKSYPNLVFRYRTSISKKEINESLQKIDSELGQTLYLPSSSIKPDGGIIEVRDDQGQWRIILVSEAKFQGKDIDNIRQGKLVGKHNDQDLMAAGNAIERSHKNISEIANYMLNETFFPYVLFLEGSNFLTQDVIITRPDGRVITLQYNSGTLNRLDRLTAANYGLPLNKNLCANRFVKIQDRVIMLQAASIYTQGAGMRWNEQEMSTVMLDIANTSIKMLAKDLFNQLIAQSL
ncbi:MAG: restriction endonuclease [Lentisphaeria bacterium]|nr:restriction endonuclease [Lentisphaeria bacterium]